MTSPPNIAPFRVSHLILDQQQTSFSILHCRNRKAYCLNQIRPILTRQIYHGRCRRARRRPLCRTKGPVGERYAPPSCQDSQATG